MRIRLPGLLLVVGALTACGGVDVTAPDGAPGRDISFTGQRPFQPEKAGGQVQFLTYNVHGLPAILTGDDTSGRIAQIAPLLNAFEVVGLQEDFMDGNHQTLADESTHTDEIRFADKLAGRVYGPGLSVFSNRPVLDLYHEHLHRLCRRVQRRDRLSGVERISGGAPRTWRWIRG